MFRNKYWPHIHIHRECCDQAAIRTQKSWDPRYSNIIEKGILLSNFFDRV